MENTRIGIISPILRNLGQQRRARGKRICVCVGNGMDDKCPAACSLQTGTQITFPSSRLHLFHFLSPLRGKRGRNFYCFALSKTSGLLLRRFPNNKQTNKGLYQRQFDTQSSAPIIHPHKKNNNKSGQNSFRSDSLNIRRKTKTDDLNKNVRFLRWGK